ncbi:MAG: FAD-dependent oxidoreductase [Bacteroidia bacterium]|jgi:monoamine oxidase|nr:FAD-dependent oxidoreductase [Bacteroidia bacterium]
MNRKEALKRLAWGVPAGLLFPHLFSSCKEKELLDGQTYNGRVIIVGAGAAGLYAAYLLHQRGADVTLLEADTVYGGRVRPLTGFSDFTIELGAEEIHGQRSLWYDMVQNSGAEFATGEEEDYIRLDGQLRAFGDVENDPDVKRVEEIADGVEDYNGADITAEQYLQQSGIPQRVMHYANAVLGNEFATSSNRLGIKGVADGDKEWTAGNKNILVRNRSFLSIIESVVQPVISKIRFNTRVVNISYGASTITLTDQNGATYTADKVIVAVPLTILRDGDIVFNPPLEQAKAAAFSRIGMGAGMKVILKFANRFWPADTGSIYGDGVVPEYWSTGGGGRSAANNILTAFVHGEKAEFLIAQGNNLVNTIVQDLDTIFGAGVASGSLQGSHIMNWTAEPHIRGAYSYPIPGGDGARELIAAPVANKIFFAGEATHTAGHFGTLHGALETGLRAATEILKSAQQ